MEVTAVGSACALVVVGESVGAKDTDGALGAEGAVATSINLLATLPPTLIAVLVTAAPTVMLALVAAAAVVAAALTAVPATLTAVLATEPATLTVVLITLQPVATKHSALMQSRVLTLSGELWRLEILSFAMMVRLNILDEIFKNCEKNKSYTVIRMSAIAEVYCPHSYIYITQYA